MKGRQTSKVGRSMFSIAAYDAAQAAVEASICRRLHTEIERALPDATSKVWHGAPVWFVGDTPVVGYSVPAKGGVVLLFWNGQALGDPALNPVGKFKAAQIQFEDPSQIKVAPLRRWLRYAGTQLWDMGSIRGSTRRSQERPSARGAHDDYLAGLPDDKRAVLEQLRQHIRAAAPRAEECISYQLPAFRLDGKVLVLFGATAKHCSFFPGSGTAVEAHRTDLEGYSTSKGTIRFEAGDPLPSTLVRKIVKYRIAENAAQQRHPTDGAARRR